MKLIMELYKDNRHLTSSINKSIVYKFINYIKTFGR